MLRLIVKGIKCLTKHINLEQHTHNGQCAVLINVTITLTRTDSKARY